MMNYYIKMIWKSTSYIDIFEKVIRFTLNTAVVEAYQITHTQIYK